ncbi:MAG: hypothetical protein QOF01_2612 [Thermomicrobiales bacterium]|jgi:hypothetical protein|nr:hypothetical protein [Thermomicrobiales bacterium]
MSVGDWHWAGRRSVRGCTRRANVVAFRHSPTARFPEGAAASDPALQSRRSAPHLGVSARGFVSA